MSQSTVPRGLINQGMTCYLNAVLQTLYMTRKYREHVLSPKEVTAPSEENVLKALANLFKKLDSRKDMAFHTKEITNALNVTDVYEQQDAAEYLQMILHKTPEPSEIFKGVMGTITTCSSCKHTYPSNTEFLSIPLSVKDKGENDVAKALKEYENQLHVMNEEDQLYCVKCHSLKNMETETFITQCPVILTLQLKRFEMTFSQKRVYYKKNEYPVNIPSDLEIYDRKYELYAIINHYGTYEGGHYVVLIKAEHDNWFHFNDHRVEEFHGTRKAIDYSCTSAYLLLYRTVTEEKMQEACSAKTETSESKRSDDTCQKPVNQMLTRAEMCYNSRVKSNKKDPEEQCTSNKVKANPVSNPKKKSAGSASQLEMFKQKMKEELQYLNEENLHGERPQLKDIFIESNMTEYNSTVDEKGITYSNLFEGEKIKTVLTKGNAGIGKTVAVQKFVLDWAEEKTNTDIKYIFLIPFQKLNIIREKQNNYSFIKLLQQCFENTENLKLNSEKIMFIFDGLNEIKFPLDFPKAKKIEDLNKSAPVAELLTNLITRNLLPNSLIWITTRPGAASQIPAEYVDQVTEIHGFNDKQKEEYFKKSINNSSKADIVISHIKKSSRVYSMCYIPDYCRIIAAMSEMMFSSDPADVPKTLTQIYATFLAAQTMNQGSNPVLGKKNLVYLGKLAFQQLADGKSLICAEDLKKCCISAKSTAIIKMIEDKSNSFCFVNHRTQEFLAALYVIEMINGGYDYKYKDIVKKFFHLKPDQEWRYKNYECLTNHSLLQNVMDKALERKLDVFLCSLLGLSLESSQRILQDVLTQREKSCCVDQKITQNIKTMILNSAPEEISHLFSCLMEQDEHFSFQKMKTLQKFGVSLSAAQWSFLVFVLLNVEEQLDEIKLNKSHQSEKRSLRTVLKTSEEPEVHQCGIGVEGCADLSLSELDWSNSYIGCSGVKQLLVLLKDPYCKLQKLWLKSCNIKDEDFADLSSAPLSNLRELDLSYNYIYDSGVKLLTELFKGLQRLLLRSCHITDEGCSYLSSALRSNPSYLRELDLSYNDIRDSGVKQISDLLEHPQCKLEKLWLRSCNIKENGCTVLSSALRSNPAYLRELDLSYNDIRDSGMKQIADLLEHPQCKLEKLLLKSCHIGERGSVFLILALTSNPSHLKELDLSENSLYCSGAQDISVYLHNSSCRLVKLMLRSCNIKEEGCTVLSSVLRSKHSDLKELDLSYNDIRDSGVKQISDLLEHPQCKLERLWLRSCYINDKGCSYLSSALRSKPSDLRELDLSNNDIADSGVKHISDLLEHPQCKLEKLGLRSCYFKDTGCSYLSSALRSKPTLLQELDLSNNEIRDSGVKHISDLLQHPQCKLEKLWLKSCLYYTGVSFTLLINSLHLRKLDLSGNYFNDLRLKQLSVLLKDPQCKVKKLWLRSCHITDEGCSYLSSALRSKHSDLRELDLSNNDITDSGVKQISDLLEHPQCKLEKLWLYHSAQGIDKSTVLSSALRSKPSYLRELDLSYNDIRDSGVKQISDLLKDPQCKLEKLWLRSCCINDSDCSYLSSALRSKPSYLRELDLSNNYIRDSGVKQISDLLKDPQCKLEKLWLRSCYVNDKGCSYLSSALRSKPSYLRELDLSNNYLADSGVKHISDLLKDPQCKLTKLWLRSCYINDRDCSYLSSALRSKPSDLRELDLSYNYIADSGVKHISDLLEHPQCKLEKLWLRSCQIKEEGCSYLSSALRSNPSHLRELDLSYNYIKDLGVKQISDLQGHMCKLEIVWMTSCGIKYEQHVLRSHKTEMYPNVNKASDIEGLENNFSNLRINQ